MLVSFQRGSAFPHPCFLSHCNSAYSLLSACADVLW